MNKDLNDNIASSDKCNTKISYFLARPDKDVDMKAGAKLTESIVHKFNDIHSGIGYFKGTLSLWVKYGVKQYQALQRHVDYELQG